MLKMQINGWYLVTGPDDVDEIMTILEKEKISNYTITPPAYYPAFGQLRYDQHDEDGQCIVYAELEYISKTTIDIMHATLEREEN